MKNATMDWNTYCDSLVQLAKDAKQLECSDTIASKQNFLKGLDDFIRVPKGADIDYVIKKLTSIEKSVSNRCNSYFKKSDADIANSAMMDFLLRIQTIISCIESYHQDGDSKTISFSNGINSTEIYKFIKYLVYTKKDFTYLCEFIDSHSSFLKIANLFSKSHLLSDLVDFYLDMLQDKDLYYDVIYYQKVIEYFLSFSFIGSDKKTRDLLVSKVLLFIDSLKRKKLDCKQERRIIFFCNDLVSSLKGNAKAMSSLDLQYKYSISKGEKMETDFHFPTSPDVLDCREKRIITVDDFGTVNYDDACSLEILPNGNFLLSVFVADVASFIPRDSSLFLSAQTKGSSIYTKSEVIFMLPESLTSLISLMNGVERYAVGFFFELNRKLELVNFDVKRSLIRVNRNFNYHTFDNILIKNNDVILYDFLKQMFDFSQLLLDGKLYGSGHKEKSISESGFDYEHSYGSNMIAAFMKYTNFMVASFYQRHQFPFIYKNRHFYDQRHIQRVGDLLLGNCSLERVKSIVDSVDSFSFYSTISSGHHSLGFPAYGEVTSPLRKFVSLDMQYSILDHMVYKKDFPLEEREKLRAYYEEICPYLNRRDKLNDHYQQESFSKRYSRKS